MPKLFAACVCGHEEEDHLTAETPGLYPCEICNCPNYRPSNNR